MKAIEQIRELLDQVEAGHPAYADSSDRRSFTGIELLSVIQEIIDDLLPLLAPYQIAYYWYLFGNSILRTGNSVLRVSSRRLGTGVFKSNRGAQVSQTQVRETLDALANVGAIRKEGEPNREGTPYRVLIPSEIAMCQEFRATRTEAVAPAVVVVDEGELDYYNIRENRQKVYERDGYKCTYCGKQLAVSTATLDHIQPVEKRGDNSFGNLTTACLQCNSEKNRRAVGDFLAER